VKSRRSSKKSFGKDLSLILTSVVVSILLIKLGLVEYSLALSANAGIVGSFVAGLFFTSLFTTVPAIAVLGEIATTQSLFLTAFVGAIGAVMGDLVLFTFLKGHVSNNIDELLKEKHIRRFTSVFRLPLFKWVTPFIGALVIASPLPDELGLTLMGVSRLSPAALIPISFVMNFIGIMLIGLVATSL